MSALALHAALLALLRTQDDVIVYDGTVPDDVPAAHDRRVKPYVVLWANPGTHPGAAADTVSDADTAEVLWETRLTVASGDPGWTLRAAVGIRDLVNKKRLTPRAGLLREPEGVDHQVLKDTDPKPVRWYVPLVFTTMSA